MSRFLVNASLVILTVSVTSGQLFSQERIKRERPLVSDVSVSDRAITFETNPVAETIQLAVSGPFDWQHTQILKGGQSGELPLETRKGFRLPDGLYRVQLSAVAKSDQTNRAQLRVARDKGDYAQVVKLNQKLAGAQQFHGTFRIVDGKFVDPSTREESDRDSEKDQGLLQPDDTRPSLQERIYLAETDFLEPRLLASTETTPESEPRYSHARIGLNPDQVIGDDLIVTRSLCVGFDCVNGENFGFTTIRMKENNLRLDFDDTSTSASFPRNDWRLEANSNLNGGSSHLAVVDLTANRAVVTIEAGAPSQSVFVDNSGRVGFGTSTPVVELHSKDGDTPTVRLEQDGSFGWSPQTWDISGNETNFFIRDATNGSQLPFRIRPGAPSSSIDIASDGAVRFGISTTARAEITADGQYLASGGALDAPGISFREETSTGILYRNGNMEFSADGQLVGRFDQRALRLHNGTVSNPSHSFFNASNSGMMHAGSDELGFVVDASEMMRLTTTGLGIGVTAPTEPLEVNGNALAAAHTTPSDARLKTNVESLENPLETVMHLRGVTFDWNESARAHGMSDERQIGLIAQEVLEIVPEVVSGTSESYSVDYAKLVPLLIEALKEQQSRIEVLEARITN